VTTVRGAVWLSALLLIAPVTACSGNSEASFEPTLEWGTCPADVEVTFVSRHECGTLTVLEDRNEPDGRTVELLAVKVWPVGVEPRPGIGTGFGGNIGDPRSLTGGIATGATRGKWIVVQIEARGAGPHVSPSLRCPETDALAAQAAASVTGDEALTTAFVAAVEACADRLRASGVDPADYDIAATAADVDDLREAIGIDQWSGVGTEGTTSRVMFEYLGAYPDRAGRAVADSPWFPEVDDLTGGAQGTRAALAQLFAACAADTACHDAYPDLDKTWQQALDRLTERPLRGTFEPSSGEAVDVLIDAPKLLRAVRFALGGDGPHNAGLLPATIAAAADGETTPWLLDTIAEDPIFCAGYRPFCTGQDGFSLGVHLTAFCRDQAPFIDERALTAAVAGDPVYEAVFVDSPYRAACEKWDVPPADPAVAEPLDTEVPLLLLAGQFDSFSPPDVAEAQAARLPMAWTITVPGQTHNTLGFAECVSTAREQWRQDPTTPPDEEACRAAPPLAFSTGD
jgi:pimeloyl-ACP methyl ester carboxylesterase